MKTTASNGTVLELGKKYCISEWKEDGWANYGYIKIIAFGKVNVFGETEEGYEIVLDLTKNFLPYEEPQPKPFEGYQKWYEKYENGLMQVCYSKGRPVNHNITYYSESEIIELGLKI